MSRAACIFVSLDYGYVTKSSITMATFIITGVTIRRTKAEVGLFLLFQDLWMSPMSFKSIPIKKLQPVIIVKKSLEVNTFLPFFVDINFIIALFNK